MGHRDRKAGKTVIKTVISEQVSPDAHTCDGVIAGQTVDDVSREAHRNRCDALPPSRIAQHLSVRGEAVVAPRDICERASSDPRIQYGFRAWSLFQRNEGDRSFRGDRVGERVGSLDGARRMGRGDNDEDFSHYRLRAASRSDSARRVHVYFALYWSCAR